MVESTAHAQWHGDLIGGAGTIDRVGSGTFGPLDVSWAARTGEESGKTTPEELLAAAHAACYAMSLAGELAAKGSAPDHVDVRAVVTLDQVEDGSHRIVASELLARARVTGIDQAALQEVAEIASDGCTLSKLIEASAKVTVNAQLEGGS